jgi:hypothetical protein
MKFDTISAVFKEFSGRGYRKIPWIKLKVNNAFSKLASPLINKNNEDYSRRDIQRFPGIHLLQG